MMDAVTMLCCQWCPNQNESWSAPPKLASSLSDQVKSRLLQRHILRVEILQQIILIVPEWNLFFTYDSNGIPIMFSYDPLHCVGLWRQNNLCMIRFFVSPAGLSDVRT